VRHHDDNNAANNCDGLDPNLLEEDSKFLQNF